MQLQRGLHGPALGTPVRRFYLTVNAPRALDRETLSTIEAPNRKQENIKKELSCVSNPLNSTLT